MLLELKNMNLYLKRDDRALAEDFSFTLARGDKAVLIGEEGNGKSTLLKAIYDRSLIEDYCDVSGEIAVRGKMAYLPQMMPEEAKRLTAAAFFDGVEVYRYSDLLSRLGMEPENCRSGQTLGTLSGGEKVRVQLCRLLMEEPDILLLDEPTNDLDIDTLRWLEGFLRETKLPVLYISHDETLIERTANVIIHMEQLIRKTRCRITVTRMGYRDYLAQRRRSFDHQDQVARKQREDHDKQMRRWRQIHDRVEHEQRSLSRQDPHGGRLLKKKMHSVQSTGKRLEKAAEDFLEFSEEEDAILVRFDPAVKLPAGKTVLDFALEELRTGDRVLARDLKLIVPGCCIIGVTGRNGAGKSTLLRAVWAQLRERRDVTAAYMPQDYAEALDYERTPLEHLEAAYSKEELTRARSFLGSMRFTHEEMTGKIARLSGGQRAKLLFLDMVLKKADVLLLDEPTRNFSPLSAPVVRTALREFGGSILSVSHDRKYLSEVCDQVYELRPDGLHLIKPPE